MTTHLRCMVMPSSTERHQCALDSKKILVFLIKQQDVAVILSWATPAVLRDVRAVSSCSMTTVPGEKEEEIKLVIQLSHSQCEDLWRYKHTPKICFSLWLLRITGPPPIGSYVSTLRLEQSSKTQHFRIKWEVTGDLWGVFNTTQHHSTGWSQAEDGQGITRKEKHYQRTRSALPIVYYT